MNLRRRLRYLLALVFTLPFVPAACDSDGIVGGECRSGHAVCQGECLRVVDDPNNCGSCGNRCEPGLACIAGQCVLPDGSGGTSGDAGVVGDATSDQSQGGDGSNPDGSAGDSSRPDGQDPDGSDLDADNPDAECLPPFNTPFRCGDCQTRCTPEEFCSPADGGFACIPCPEPLRRCGNVCIDLNTDALNCGRCGNVCPTRLCQGGRCVGAAAGHLVLMCTNYEQTPVDSPHTRALANAVFLPPGNAVRILAYQQYSVPLNKNKVDSLINASAATRSRTVQITPATDAPEVVANLNVLSYDVFLVYDQRNAPADTLGPIGTSWNATLTSFARAGGIVIVMDSGTGTAEMDALITNAGLLNVTGESEINAITVFNRAPGDAIGIGVLSPYLSQRETCTFVTSARPSPEQAFVITTATEDGTPGDPVIVHRIVVP